MCGDKEGGGQGPSVDALTTHHTTPHTRVSPNTKNRRVRCDYPPTHLVLDGRGGDEDPPEDEAGGRQRDEREGRDLVVGWGVGRMGGGWVSCYFYFFFKFYLTSFTSCRVVLARGVGLVDSHARE